MRIRIRVICVFGGTFVTAGGWLQVPPPYFSFAASTVTGW